MPLKKLTGKVSRESIRLFDLPKLPANLVKGFKTLSDLTATVSDALDQLGIVGVIPASILIPIVPNSCIVGPAITVRNVSRREQIYKAAKDGINTMGDSEAHNLAKPGDVLVIEGIIGCSNFGGQSGMMGLRQQEAGAIIDGSIRDPDEERRIGFPVWCRGVTPITGKWRIQTVEVNGPVHIFGVQVHPGDLVCADDAGVAFIPYKQIAKVLKICQKIDARTIKRRKDIENGISVTEVMQRKYK